MPRQTLVLVGVAAGLEVVRLHTCTASRSGHWSLLVMMEEYDSRGDERSVKESDSRRSVSTDRIEAVEVDFFAHAAVEIRDFQREGSRAQDHILQGTESKVVDLAVHGHDVLVAVLVDGLTNHVAGIVLWVRLHPGRSEGLMQSVSISIDGRYETPGFSP